MNADKRRFFVMVMVLALCVIALHGATVRAQPPDSPPPLPADLLFVTNTETYGDYARNAIMRADAQTLEVSPFFIDIEAGQLMPLSWSPQGDLLAVYRLLPAIDDAYTLFPRQLCIVWCFAVVYG